MRVLYVASNPPGEVDLNLPREITELQRPFTTALGEASFFEFLPALKVEDLPNQLRFRSPDILHIAAHGDSASLYLSDEAGNPVALTAEMLLSFLPPERSPRIVYLNACDSYEIARALVDSGRVPIAIGSTAPISNRTARAGAVAFYERLLAGHAVGVAFEACEAMVKALSGKKAGAKILNNPGVDVGTETMHMVPTLVAEFESKKPVLRKDGHHEFHLGLLGCPPCTGQVVFFSDDETFVTGEGSLEDDLCTVIRTQPVNGRIWMDDDYWLAEGDYRIYAVGTTAEGSCYSVASTLCKAIERHYRPLHGGRLPSAIDDAIKYLLKNNGERASSATQDNKSPKTKKSKGKRPKGTKRA